MKRLLRSLLLTVFAVVLSLSLNPAASVKADDTAVTDSTVRITVGETNRNYTRYVVSTDNPEWDKDMIYSDPSKVTFRIADSSIAELVNVEAPVKDEKETYDYLGHEYTSQWNRSYYTVKALSPGTTHVEVYYDGKKVFDQPDIEVSAPIKMWRLYNPNSGEHFYTKDTHERDVLYSKGWNIEGVGWTAPAEGAPVYRVYNPNGGDHHYTTSKKEKDTLAKLGWRYEGIGWYSGGDIVLKREYNPNAFSCNHNYTTDEKEHNHLLKVGWNDEGNAWNALSKGSSEGARVHPKPAPAAPSKPASSTNKSSASGTYSGPFVATASGSKFHRPDCPTIKRRRITRSFNTVAEAEKAGLEPCDVCLKELVK